MDKSNVSTRSLFTVTDINSGMDAMSFRPIITTTIVIDNEAVQDCIALLSAEEFITMCGTQFKEEILR